MYADICSNKFDLGKFAVNLSSRENFVSYVLEPFYKVVTATVSYEEE
jgi:hypothetical protein